MFAYKEKVPWSEFAGVLNALFDHNTGRGLTQEHLDYLMRLLPGHSGQFMLCYEMTYCVSSGT